MTRPTPDAHDPTAAGDNRLVVAISSRALFDLGDSHELFEHQGLDAYRTFQIEHENELLKPGVAFPLVQKLLGLNKLAGDVPPVEVILLSRNSGDTGLRIFNAIQHYGLEISRAAFTSGAPTSDYIAPFKADLFLPRMRKTWAARLPRVSQRQPSCRRSRHHALPNNCASPSTVTR